MHRTRSRSQTRLISRFYEASSSGEYLANALLDWKPSLEQNGNLCIQRKSDYLSQYNQSTPLPLYLLTAVSYFSSFFRRNLHGFTIDSKTLNNRLYNRLRLYHRTSIDHLFGLCLRISTCVYISSFEHQRVKRRASNKLEYSSKNQRPATHPNF